MTRKHFKAVAAILAREKNEANAETIGTREFNGGRCYAAKEIAVALCDVFKAANPRFDRERFLTACDCDPRR